MKRLFPIGIFLGIRQEFFPSLSFSGQNSITGVCCLLVSVRVSVCTSVNHFIQSTVSPVSQLWGLWCKERCACADFILFNYFKVKWSRVSVLLRCAVIVEGSECNALVMAGVVRESSGSCGAVCVCDDGGDGRRRRRRRRLVECGVCAECVECGGATQRDGVPAVGAPPRLRRVERSRRATWRPPPALPGYCSLALAPLPPTP